MEKSHLSLQGVSGELERAKTLLVILHEYLDREEHPSDGLKPFTLMGFTAERMRAVLSATQDIIIAAIPVIDEEVDAMEDTLNELSKLRSLMNKQREEQKRRPNEAAGTEVSYVSELNG